MKLNFIKPEKLKSIAIFKSLQTSTPQLKFGLSTYSCNNHSIINIADELVHKIIHEISNCNA